MAAYSTKRSASWLVVLNTHPMAGQNTKTSASGHIDWIGILMLNLTGKNKLTTMIVSYLIFAGALVF